MYSYLAVISEKATQLMESARKFSSILTLPSRLMLVKTVWVSPFFLRILLS